MSSYFSTAPMGCSWKIRSDGGGEEAPEKRRKSKSYIYPLDICANYSIRSIYEFHAYFHSFTSEPPLLGLNYNLNKTNKIDATSTSHLIQLAVFQRV